MTQKLIRAIEQAHLKSTTCDFQAGDLVKVKVLIREGKKERNQAFEGMVIAIRGGGINQTFTVRRIFQGVAIERTFLMNSPKVTEVSVVRKGKTRRSKLYYMRERIGTKKTRLREDSSRIARDFQAKLVAQESELIDNNNNEEEVVTTA
jgi:large subunit ribosomal protein L19